MGREHVQTAVSRGIPSSLVVRRHVLRNAAIPITTLVGITIASLIALSAVVERAFSLERAGRGARAGRAVQGLRRRAGDLADLVTAFVVANMVVDLLYAVLDPRVAIGSRAI